MGPLAIVTIVLLLVAVLVGAAITFRRNRRSAALKGRYGAEYSRTVARAGDTHKAERQLREREKQVAAFDIHPLAPAQRHDFIDRWLDVQALFVIDPAGAVARADVLLTDVMLARGYPMAQFEQRYEYLSVDHGEVVAHYRTAHAIAESHARGEVRTEELRQAMIHYRTLFDDLVNEPVDDTPVIAHRDGRIHDLRREAIRRD
jgi:hypothetical protein